VAYVWLACARRGAPAVLYDVVRMDGRAKTGGTWATEQHGGSDVGATTTTAQRKGDGFALHGLKWFTSNANSGLAVATARPKERRPVRQDSVISVPSHWRRGSRITIAFAG